MEAPYLTTIRYSLDGFDAQTSLGTHDNAADHLDRIAKLLEELQKAGAGPARRWESNHKPLTTPESQTPVCAECHQSDQMELVTFQKNGHPKSAWKCQKCKKWAPD